MVKRLLGPTGDGSDALREVDDRKDDENGDEKSASDVHVVARFFGCGGRWVFTRPLSIVPANVKTQTCGSPGGWPTRTAGTPHRCGTARPTERSAAIEGSDGGGDPRPAVRHRRGRAHGTRACARVAVGVGPMAHDRCLRRGDRDALRRRADADRGTADRRLGGGGRLPGHRAGTDGAAGGGTRRRSPRRGDGHRDVRLGALGDRDDRPVRHADPQPDHPGGR